MTNATTHEIVVHHPDGSRTYLGSLALDDLDGSVELAIRQWESKQKRRNTSYQTARTMDAVRRNLGKDDIGRLR